MKPLRSCSDNQSATADLSIEVDGFQFDTRIGCVDEFVGKQRKRVYWKGGRPYAVRRDSGATVGFHALHFQADGKKVMPMYASERGLDVLASWVRRKTKSPVHRLRRQFVKRQSAISEVSANQAA